MPKRPINRALLRIGTVATAAALIFGVTAPAVFAQETTAPAPTETTETTAPPTTAEPPTSQEPAPSEPPAETSTPTSTSTPAPQPKVEATTGEADLEVTVTFDKDEYLPDEEIKAKVVVRNVGTAAAHDVQLNRSGNVWVSKGNELFQPIPAFEPGAIKSADLVVRQSNNMDSSAELSVQAFLVSAPDPTPHNNTGRDTAKVLQQRGTFTGLLYEDKDDNGWFSVGDVPIKGMTVRAYGGRPSNYLQRVTDAEGRFTFAEVPTGKYNVALNDGSGLVVKPGQSEITVHPGQSNVVAIAAVRPVSDVLRARLELDRDTYGKNDPVNVKVTLTNSGTKALTGVVATCNHVGEGHVLDGTGPGWAPLDYRGQGTTVPAGQTVTLTIPDVVPDGAYNLGRLMAECNFGNNGYHEDGYVGASDEAEVVGATGNATGVVFHDQNGDHQPEGEGLAGLKLVALHPTTKKPIASTVTGANGEWSFTALPVGSLPIVIVGPWKDRYGSDGHGIWVLGGQTSTSSFSVVPGPDVADPTPNAPDLKVTASFDKQAYRPGEQVTAKVVITNQGTGKPALAKFRDVGGPGSFDFDHNQWGDLGRGGRNIAEGETVEVTLTGTPAPYLRVVALSGVIDAEGDADPSDNKIDIKAEYLYAKGDAAVVVYGDANENGQLDAGEELANREARISGGQPWEERETTTDASGKAAFSGLSTGKYHFYALYEDENDWVPESSSSLELVVTEGGITTAQYRMVRPLSDEVKASIVFDRPSYEPGAHVGLTVKITNNSTENLVFHALCGLDGGYSLNNTSEWGPLAYDGPGLPVATGETKSLHVTQAMPAVSPDHGLVDAGCEFSPELGKPGAPWAYAKTKVPGATWTTSGSLRVHDTDQPVANTKIVLLDIDTDQPVARTFADASGRFTFPNLPVGHYTPVVVGPWKVTHFRSGPLFASVRGSQDPQDIRVLPGPEVADPDAGLVTPPSNAPLSQARGGGLATTGVSVLGLIAFGLLLVTAGAALRRRPIVAA